MLKFIRKRIFYLIIFMSMSICFDVFCFSGWNLIDGEFVYLDAEGKMLCNVFKESNGAKYYLGENGYMVKNSLIEYSGEIYYLDEYGKMMSNRCMEINEKTNVNDGFEDGVYCFDENGRAYRRRGEKDFKKNINGHYYAVDYNGKILTGWLDESGNVLDDNSDIFTSGYYYANGDGVLLHNAWYDFCEDIGFFERLEDSAMVSEKYDYMDRMWMYFGNDCKKTYSKADNIEKKEINGRAYAFDENGIMLEGFTKNGALDISQASNPALVENVKLYDKKEGDLVKGKWIRTVPSMFMSEEDYSNNEEKWFLIGDDGNLVKNRFKNVNGKRYAFDGVGRMQTGFIMAADNIFKAQYNTDDLTRDDFMYHVSEGGHLYGSDLCSLYYFVDSENATTSDDEGMMQTGEVQIKLDDGIYTFKFKDSNGEAFGEHTTLKKSKDSYYINGLKLCAWDGNRYGILKISNTEYKVVNDKGRLVRGKRKLLRDDNGNYMIIRHGNLVGYILDTSDWKIKWRKAKEGVVAGYYFYDSDVKDFVGMAVSGSAEMPTPEQIESIPDDMKVNFK